MKHKWHKEITAFVSGEKIEVKGYRLSNEWESIDTESSVPLSWFDANNGCEFRLYDPYRELKEAEARGEQIQHLSGNPGIWYDLYNPEYVLKPEEYRIKPKEVKKVKKWQWILKYKDDREIISAKFFVDESDVLKLYKHYTIIQKALWTEIEVEK